MKVSEIIDGYKGKYRGRDISNLAFRLSEIGESTLYFNLKNDLSAIEAENYGAVVVEEKGGVLRSSIKVKNIRASFALACKRFYNNASDKLKLFAVTGTNGKTTTASILKDILTNNGVKTALIGTNGVVIGSRVYPPTLTTPDPDKLHAIFDECVKSGVVAVVMEASAHALELKKLEGLRFVSCGFTNLSQDHLDFFENMERYSFAKATLFEKCENAVVNFDDDFGKKLAEKENLLTYGVEQGELRASEIELLPSGSKFIIEFKGNQAKVDFSISGRYNISNALCAVGLALSAGLDFHSVVNSLSVVSSVPGRMQRVERDGKSVIIDYAHTDDGLKNLLLSVREHAKGKIIVVFGCGGDRDKTKRSLMGRVASEYADIVVVTSDNPRYEKREDIIEMIVSGINGEKGVNYFIEKDREKAIKLALDKATQDDLVVIAGKGAENYIDEMGVKRPYSDFTVVEKLLKERSDA